MILFGRVYQRGKLLQIITGATEGQILDQIRLPEESKNDAFRIRIEDENGNGAWLYVGAKPDTKRHTPAQPEGGAR